MRTLLFVAFALVVLSVLSLSYNAATLRAQAGEQRLYVPFIGTQIEKPVSSGAALSHVQAYLPLLSNSVDNRTTSSEHTSNSDAPILASSVGDEVLVTVDLAAPESVSLMHTGGTHTQYSLD